MRLHESRDSSTADSQTYLVTAGKDTSCLPPLPSQDSTDIPSILPNVTGTISTCDPWGLQIVGGQKPYQIALSACDSPVITNVTMGPDDDVFTFIDRADPNGQLMGEQLHRGHPSRVNF